VVRKQSQVKFVTLQPDKQTKGKGASAKGTVSFVSFVVDRLSKDNEDFLNQQGKSNERIVGKYCRQYNNKD
jgi:secreted trypsin-like serine protease